MGVEALPAGLIWQNGEMLSVLTARDDLLNAEAPVEPLACPATIIYGTADRLLPANEVAALAASLGADMMPIDNAGHFPQLDAPGATVGAIAEFLEEMP